jgi:glutathione synthase/RimK-type ligase-like ATP-grasp enzyme
MKKILILDNKIGDYPQKLVDYLKSTNKFDIYIKTLSEISFKINTGKVEGFMEDIDLKDFSLIYFRKVNGFFSVAVSVAEFLKTNNIKFIDESFKNISALGNKLLDTVKLANNNIPVISSYLFSKQNIEKNTEKIASEFGFPIYTKSLSVHQRKGLFVINKENDFKKLLEDNNSSVFLLQKKIEIEKEYRLVVMGDKVAAIHIEAKRKIEGNHMLINDEESVGGWIRSTEVPKEMLELAISGTKCLNLNISGVDACIEKETGKIYIIEINRLPGLTLNPDISPELPELAKYLDKLITS